MSDLAKAAQDGIVKGRLSPDFVERLCGDEVGGVEQLMLDLIPFACEFSSPVISGFSVGAVARGISGALYLGANYEFPTLPLNQTIHAEQAAVVAAGIHGEKGLLSLAISAPPCGSCRQFLWELATASELQIVLPDTPGASLKDYLPAAFGPEDLDSEARMLASEPLALSEPEGVNDFPGMREAFEAACKSYAPYTKAYGGAAVVTSDGTIFAAPYWENAAFNPSLSPMQGAIIAAKWGGYSSEDIKKTVVVQTKGSKIDHVASAKVILGVAASEVPVREVFVSL